jgi:hypothetical protein
MVEMEVKRSKYDENKERGITMIIRAKCWRMLSVQEKLFILKAVCNKHLKK